MHLGMKFLSYTETICLAFCGSASFLDWVYILHSYQ